MIPRELRDKNTGKRLGKVFRDEELELIFQTSNRNDIHAVITLITIFGCCYNKF